MRVEMGVVIGAKPDSSFAEPLGLLSDCHRRIEKFLQMLINVVSSAEANASDDVDLSLDADQVQTLEVALRYFRSAAPRHTQDEEESLFPKMRASGDPAALAALAIIDALEADHDVADSIHGEVDRLGAKWLDSGRLGREELAAMHDMVQQLQTLYDRHINIEDTQVFPLASRILAVPILQSIGREMAVRRDINLDGLPDFKPRCPHAKANFTKHL